MANTELTLGQLETIKGASMHQGAMNSAFKDAARNISTGQPVEQPLSKRKNPTVETHIDFAVFGVKDEWHRDKLTGGFDALNETKNFDDKGYSPISGEGVFKPQDIDAKGSVIFGDNHFKPGRGGDAIPGEDLPTKIWTNGGASTFEDSNWIWQDCNDFKSDQDINDVVIGVKENIDWTAANGGPGSSYLTAKTTSKTNAYVDEDVDGFIKLGDIKGELQTTDQRSDNRFVIETFEQAPGMDLAGSLNPVPEDGGNSYDCRSFGADHHLNPKLNWDAICDVGTA